ncbi:hypothetical protein Fmac_028010 [Flemingia macrophylla]|uniref:Uncharacterized protein n=1 Tax=Flemingia macrophylla TaxID=520843 RepID=A0ABD1LJJ2_9FABA
MQNGMYSGSEQKRSLAGAGRVGMSDLVGSLLESVQMKTTHSKRLWVGLWGHASSTALLLRASPPPRLTSFAPHLLRATPPSRLTSSARHLLRGSPPSRDTSSARHLLHASPPPRDTSFAPHLLRATPPPRDTSFAPHLLRATPLHETSARNRCAPHLRHTSARNLYARHLRHTSASLLSFVRAEKPLRLLLLRSDDEWIVEERDNVDDGEENVDVEQEQPQGEGEGGGDGVNVQLDGGGSSSSNPTLDEFHLDKLVFDDDLSEHSSEENVDGDDENDDEDLGVGDDIIRGLDMDI